MNKKRIKISLIGVCSSVVLLLCVFGLVNFAGNQSVDPSSEEQITTAEPLNSYVQESVPSAPDPGVDMRFAPGSLYTEGTPMEQVVESQPVLGEDLPGAENSAKAYVGAETLELNQQINAAANNNKVKAKVNDNADPVMAYYRLINDNTELDLAGTDPIDFTNPYTSFDTSSEIP